MEHNEPAGVDLPKIGLVALLACGSLLTIGLFLSGPILPEIARHFAATPNVTLLTGLVGTIAGFSFAIAAPLSGWVIARVGCRSVLIVALIIFLLAGLTPAVVDNIRLILVCRAISGAAVAAIAMAGLTGINALRPALSRRMLGWNSTISGAASLVAFPLVGLLSHYDWRLAFLLNLIALPILALVLVLPAALGKADDAHRIVQKQASGDAPSWFNRNIVALLIVSAILGMVMLLAPIYSPLFLASFGITDPRLLSIPITAGALTSTIAAAGYGRLQRKIGHIGIWIVMPLGMGAALMLASMSNSLLTLTLALALLNAMIPILSIDMIPLAAAWAGPAKASQAIGLVSGLQFGSQILFPFVSAGISAWAGLNGIFIMFAGAMLLIGCFSVVRAVLARRSTLLG